MIEKIDKNYFNPENEAKRNKLKAYLVDEIDLYFHNRIPDSCDNIIDVVCTLLQELHSDTLDALIEGYERENG